MSISVQPQCTSCKSLLLLLIAFPIRYKPGPFVDVALEVLNIRANARALSFKKHSKEWNILSQFFRNVLVEIKLPKKTVTKKIVGLVEAAGRFPFTQESEDGSSLPTTVEVRSA